jgi:hypothetical protein
MPKRMLSADFWERVFIHIFACGRGPSRLLLLLIVRLLPESPLLPGCELICRAHRPNDHRSHISHTLDLGRPDRPEQVPSIFRVCEEGLCPAQPASECARALGQPDRLAPACKGSEGAFAPLHSVGNEPALMAATESALTMFSIASRRLFK